MRTSRIISPLRRPAAVHKSSVLMISLRIIHTVRSKTSKSVLKLKSPVQKTITTLPDHRGFERSVAANGISFRGSGLMRIDFSREEVSLENSMVGTLVPFDLTPADGGKNIFYGEFHSIIN